jgi:O-antigen biosynthesis protein
MGSERCKTVMAGIDFCLKLRSLSYLNTWTPYAELTITREACYPFDPTNAEQKADLEVLMQVWKSWFEADPAYNPNLSLRSLYTGLADVPRLELC